MIVMLSHSMFLLNKEFWICLYFRRKPIIKKALKDSRKSKVFCRKRQMRSKINWYDFLLGIAFNSRQNICPALIGFSKLFDLSYKFWIIWEIPKVMRLKPFTWYLVAFESDTERWLLVPIFEISPFQVNKSPNGDYSWARSLRS